MTYYITLTVAGDLAATPAETIVGMKEDAAAYFERYGVVRDVRVHADEPTQQQITVSGWVPEVGAGPPGKSMEKSPRKTREVVKPPSLPEVLSYAAERRALGEGMADNDAEAWYDDCCTKKWRYGRNMTPVLNWQAHFRTGERHQAEWARERAERKVAQEKTQGSRQMQKGFQSDCGPSFDLEEYERRTLLPVQLRGRDEP